MSDTIDKIKAWQKEEIAYLDRLALPVILQDILTMLIELDNRIKQLETVKGV